ncbi:ileal sodium/bile acid cotransporter-like [Convolutriloba macropyga]|uniref:ileal sodium/bile acid cotransporter-like n=1 Tax=Convolutriloba macropyga TaxID=536237 RepID=UPI003F526155
MTITNCYLLATCLLLIAVVYPSLSVVDFEVLEFINKRNPGESYMYDGDSLKFIIVPIGGGSLTDVVCESVHGNIVNVKRLSQSGENATFMVTTKRIGNEIILCEDRKSSPTVNTVDGEPNQDPQEDNKLQVDVTVLLEPTWLDPIFSYIGMTVLILLNVLFGTEISLRDIRFILMRPKPLIAAALCQFVILPPYGLGVARLLGFEPDVALGVLMVACAPGGGISNTASFLVAGEVPLSISMSFFSTAIAAGTMPLNLFIYSRFISDDPSFSAANIPYSTLITNLVIIALPVCLGMLLMAYAKERTLQVKRFAKPFVLVMLLVYIGLALYKSSFAFKLFSLRDYLGGCLLPLGGFIIGALAATILRLRFSQTKTISLEVGMQNTLIVVTMINLVFEPPQSNLNSLMPISIAIMTCLVAIPFFLIHYFTYKYSERYREVCESNREEQLRQRQRFEGVGGTIRRRLSSVVMTGQPPMKNPAATAATSNLDPIPDDEYEIEGEGKPTESTDKEQASAEDEESK